MFMKNLGPHQQTLDDQKLCQGPDDHGLIVHAVLVLSITRAPIHTMQQNRLAGILLI